MSYYKTIDGKKYDGSIIEAADKLTNNNAGNNPISMDDAKVLLAAVKDGKSYSDIEKEDYGICKKNVQVDRQS